MIYNYENELILYILSSRISFTLVFITLNSSFIQFFYVSLCKEFVYF